MITPTRVAIRQRVETVHRHFVLGVVCPECAARGGAALAPPVTAKQWAAVCSQVINGRREAGSTGSAVCCGACDVDLVHIAFHFDDVAPAAMAPLN